MDENAAEILTKFAPFLLRSRAVVVGRPRLLQMRRRLEFVLFARDLSENSRHKLGEQFDCPVIETLDSRRIEELFGFRNTKVLGFRRCDLSRQVRRLLSRATVSDRPSGGENGDNETRKDDA